MFKKLISLILTTLIISGVMTYVSYTPVSERASDTMYESLGGIFMLHLLYAFPIILVSGVIVDLIIGFLLKNASSVWNNFFARAILYVLSGVIIALILINVFTREEFAVAYSLFIAGSTALIYFLLSNLLLRTSPNH